MKSLLFTQTAFVQAKTVSYIELYFYTAKRQSRRLRIFNLCQIPSVSSNIPIFELRPHRCIASVINLIHPMMIRQKISFTP